jgi:hypothetical protein
MGNHNSGKRKDKLFHNAIMLELTEAENGKDLRKIARNVIAVACDITHKDMLSAANVIADRIDGKVPQGLVGGDDDDNPLTIIQKIELVAPGLVRNITD